jgi:hypothetical protein
MSTRLNEYTAIKILVVVSWFATTCSDTVDHTHTHTHTHKLWQWKAIAEEARRALVRLFNRLTYRLFFVFSTRNINIKLMKIFENKTCRT